jgi:hypothetical protein
VKATIQGQEYKQFGRNINIIIIIIIIIILQGLGQRPVPVQNFNF